MKNNHFIFLFLLLNYFQHNYCFSQNLVPNPSFETVTNCNDLGAGISLGWVPPWDSPSLGSPDGYNTCIPLGSSSSIPANNFGYQYPHSGNGYAGAGFYAFSGVSFCPFSYVTEYFQIKLDTPMIEFRTYCASFYVNHANHYYSAALGNFGIYFSNIHTYDSTYCNLSYIPQIIEPNIISDDSAWTLVYGQYTSHGGEKYLIIGNFNSVSTSDTVHLVNTGFTADTYQAYYYIDDINVHCCTCDSTTSLHAGVGEIKNEDDVSVYPNPATNSLTVTLIKGEGVLAIYNVLGEKVFTTKIINTQTEIDVSEWARGMYFVEVRTEKGVRRKKIVKE